MTERQACENCRWWDNSSSSAHPTLAEAETETGFCRRWPPGFDDRTGLAVWPFTEESDWCGEFSASFVVTS